MLDPGEISFIMHNLGSGDTAVDIGAHKGGYTYWMYRAVGPGGKVFCFEPQPCLADYLKKIVMNSGYKTIIIENLALSSRRGSAELFITGSKKASSPGASLEIHKNKGTGRSCTVNTETLTDYLRTSKVRPVKLIKCDVEGHELEVFKGAEGILREDCPVLLFECESRHHGKESIHGVFKFLKDLGYKGYFFLRSRLLPLSALEDEKVKNPGTRINNFVFRMEKF
jgi:FkbM family methyltransferase